MDVECNVHASASVRMDQAVWFLREMKQRECFFAPKKVGIGSSMISHSVPNSLWAKVVLENVDAPSGIVVHIHALLPTLVLVEACSMCT